MIDPVQLENPNNDYDSDHGINTEVKVVAGHTNAADNDDVTPVDPLFSTNDVESSSEDESEFIKQPVRYSRVQNVLQGVYMTTRVTSQMVPFVTPFVPSLAVDPYKTLLAIPGTALLYKIEQYTHGKEIGELHNVNLSGRQVAAKFATSMVVTTSTGVVGMYLMKTYGGPVILNIGPTLLNVGLGLTGLAVLKISEAGWECFQPTRHRPPEEEMQPNFNQQVSSSLMRIVIAAGAMEVLCKVLNEANYAAILKSKDAAIIAVAIDQFLEGVHYLACKVHPLKNFFGVERTAEGYGRVADDEIYVDIPDLEAEQRLFADASVATKTRKVARLALQVSIIMSAGYLLNAAMNDIRRSTGHPDNVEERNTWENPAYNATLVAMTIVTEEATKRLLFPLAGKVYQGGVKLWNNASTLYGRCIQPKQRNVVELDVSAQPSTLLLQGPKI